MHGDVSHESKVRSIDPASKFLVQEVEPTRLLVLVTFMCMISGSGLSIDV